ncbi:hypothetical protein KR067_002207 [Drosophila pandora]|nr:hypothetical protein KR067_002207 [Drosophila pandora]
MRPYICIMELPINRPGSGNLLLGLTSVFGLIGGAYLLQCGAQRVLGKLANKKWTKEETREDQNCNVCCADLDLSSAKNYVTCCTCGKSVCRGLKCADWRPKDAKWECQLCQNSKESLAHTSSWVAEQMSFNQHKFVYPMRARSEVYIPIAGDGNDSSMQFESVSQIGQANNLDERAKIREYVEQIVAEMLGGNLDQIKVGQLSKSENYLQLFDKFHAKLSNLLINLENGLCARALKGDLPAIVNGYNNSSNANTTNNNNNNNELADISQTRLRSLIETIIAETLRSSSLSASGAVSEISLDTRSHVSELANGNGLKRRHRTEHYFEPKIYQDLLATAVLNKIADKEGNTRLLAESTPDLSGHHIDENFNAEALSTTSGSSIEPRSDSSLTDHEIVLDNGKSQSLQAELERESVLSDYIAAHMVPLPDFSASVTESEDGNYFITLSATHIEVHNKLSPFTDVGSISSSMIADGTWEDNWLFKKKRSSATPSSIGMLVPAPKENVRAQIGDKTADEVSDLSEMGSDAEDSSLDLMRCNELNDRLLSKHLIGGQNTKLVLDELVDRTSLISHTLPEEHEPAFTETTNVLLVETTGVAPPVSPPPPPPMVFQDDSLTEEPVPAPIAAQADSEEPASLDGCTGFSTIEYIDEEQMHESVPSVIEILAAMALGPMLAVPASEQPGAMTPSEMHTLKELSDLALAEINARTMELAHHSLDIIEEENTEPVETDVTNHILEPSAQISAKDTENLGNDNPMISKNDEAIDPSPESTAETSTSPLTKHNPAPESTEIAAETPAATIPAELAVTTSVPDFITVEAAEPAEPPPANMEAPVDYPVPEIAAVEAAPADPIPAPVEAPVDNPVPESTAVESAAPSETIPAPVEAPVDNPVPEIAAIEAPAPAKTIPAPVEAPVDNPVPEIAAVEAAAPAQPIPAPVEAPVDNPVPEIAAVEAAAPAEPIPAPVEAPVDNPVPESTAVEAAAPADPIPAPVEATVDNPVPENAAVNTAAPAEPIPAPVEAPVDNPVPEIAAVETAAPAETIPAPAKAPVDNPAPESTVVEAAAPAETFPAPVEAPVDNPVPESTAVEAAAPADPIPAPVEATVDNPVPENAAVNTAAPAEPIPAPVEAPVDNPVPEIAAVEAAAPAEPIPAPVGAPVDNPVPESNAVETAAPAEPIPAPVEAPVDNPVPEIAAVEAAAPAEPIPAPVEAPVDNPAPESTAVETAAPSETIPAPVEAPVANPVPESTVVETAAPAETFPAPVEAPVDNPVPESTVVETAAPAETFPAPVEAPVDNPVPESTVVETAAPAETFPAPVEAPVDNPVPENAAVNTAAPSETIPAPVKAPVDNPVPEIAAAEAAAPAETIPAPVEAPVDNPVPESTAVETAAPAELIPAPVEAPVDNPVPESTVVETAAPAEPIPAPVEAPVDNPAPESTAVETAAPAEPIPAPVEAPVDNPDPEIAAVEAVAPAETIPAPVEAPVDIPVPESTVVETAAPAEPIPAPVEAPVDNPVPEIAAVEAAAPAEPIPAPVEAPVDNPVPETTAVETAAPAEPIPAPVEAPVDNPAPESTVVETAAPAEPIPAPVEAPVDNPAPESTAVEAAAPAETVPAPVEAPVDNPVPEIAAVEAAAPAEPIPAPVEAPVGNPVPESNAVETAAPAETIPAPVEAPVDNPVPEIAAVEAAAPAEPIPAPVEAPVDNPVPEITEEEAVVPAEPIPTPVEAPVDNPVPESAAVETAASAKTAPAPVEAPVYTPVPEIAAQESAAPAETIPTPAEAPVDSPASEIFSAVGTSEAAETISSPAVESSLDNLIVEPGTVDSAALKSSADVHNILQTELLDPTQGSGATESTKSDASTIGKASQKCLRRQPNITDTIPSEGNLSLKSDPVNLLGTICKFYIKDKRLLATIERRRRRALIMHKYLSSFDSMDDSIEDVGSDSHPSLFQELNEDGSEPQVVMIPPNGRVETPPPEVDIEDAVATSKTECVEESDQPECLIEIPKFYNFETVKTETHFVDEVSTEVTSLMGQQESPVKNLDDRVPVSDSLATILRWDRASQTSCDMADELDRDTESFIAVSLGEITYNFINDILFSDQLSTESNHSDESEPSTACETFNGEADSEQDFVSERVLVLDEHRSPSTNTNSNRTSHANLHLTLTKTNTSHSASRCTNGKLTNGSLRWSSKSVNDIGSELTNGGPKVAQPDDVADDDVVLLRRFVPGSIAEREVKKWYNAVEMPNNPYAPEALKQRISGTQERYMDVPNISPSAEQKALASALTESTDSASPQTDYKRYSRDYYINDAPNGTPGSVRTNATASASINSEDAEDIVINEVNQEPEPLPPTHGQRISSSAQSNIADLSHWTLSTPVRRSSSLKFINSRPAHSHTHSHSPSLSPTPYASASLAYDRSAHLERPSTSASHYRESSLGIGDDDHDFDVRSHRSWRSSYSSLPKRHTQSTLSLHSSGSGVSFGSSASKRRLAAGGPSAGVLTQFEKQLLHKDLKRNSFRAVSTTSKDFVMNPLFESEPIQAGKLALRPDTDEQGDSGVDSCLNGFSGADTKYSNNSLLF